MEAMKTVATIGCILLTLYVAFGGAVVLWDYLSSFWRKPPFGGDV